MRALRLLACDEDMSFYTLDDLKRIREGREPEPESQGKKPDVNLPDHVGDGAINVLAGADGEIFDPALTWDEWRYYSADRVFAGQDEPEPQGAPQAGPTGAGARASGKTKRQRYVDPNQEAMFGE